MMCCTATIVAPDETVVKRGNVNVSKPLIIKKYGNRRLYNTAESRYVNLDEVAQMIRDGKSVQVVDANSGEDLTRLILTQIIVEDAKATESGFPLDLLRQMVVASGRLTQESVLKYTKTMMDMYRNAYGAFTPPIAPFDLFHSMAPSGHSGRDSETTSEQPRQSPPNAQDVGELRRRIEELEKMVSRSESAGKKNRRKEKQSS